MLSLEEIGQSVRNNLQLIIDSQKLKLAVGPISDDDYRILCGGFGDLEWEWGLSQYGNNEDRFEFCVKLVKDVVEGVPSGLALCVYDIGEQTFRIHMIERFARDDTNHPLKGRMVILTLMAAYLFGMAVEGRKVQIVHPVQDLITYYESFGFTLHKEKQLMEVNLSVLESAFEKFTKIV